MATKIEMLYRIAAAIEGGSRTSSFFPLSSEKAEVLAREVLDNTGWQSFAAAYRYLDSKRIPYS